MARIPDVTSFLYQTELDEYQLPTCIQCGEKIFPTEGFYLKTDGEYVHKECLIPYFEDCGSLIDAAVNFAEDVCRAEVV